LPPRGNSGKKKSRCAERRRYYCKSLGPYGGYARRFDKSGLLSPNSRLFTDPVEALDSLDGLIARKINALEERRQVMNQNKQAIFAFRA
jgi:hypothetical protein